LSCFHNLSDCYLQFLLYLKGLESR